MDLRFFSEKQKENRKAAVACPGLAPGIFCQGSDLFI